MHYPEAFEPRDSSYTDVTHTVLLTNGQTNYRRSGLAERRDS